MNSGPTWINPEGHDADAEEMILLSRLPAVNPLLDKVNARLAELGQPEIEANNDYRRFDDEGTPGGPPMQVDTLMDLLSDRPNTARMARMVACPQIFMVKK